MQLLTIRNLYLFLYETNFIDLRISGLPFSAALTPKQPQGIIPRQGLGVFFFGFGVFLVGVLMNTFQDKLSTPVIIGGSIILVILLMFGTRYKAKFLS